ncbi:MAG: ATP-binding cassette domain-containing protein [Treponema sp.]
MFAACKISVTFSENGIKAVDTVSLSFKAGCIHAIVGENGAGKSTFARVCTGHVQADSGRVLLHKQPLHITCPADGIRQGIVLVPQHPQLCSDVTVWEHLYAGVYTDSTLEPQGIHRFFPYNKKKIISYIEKQLANYGILLPLQMKTRFLDTAGIHWAACAEALLKNPKVLFLDEPSAPYSPQETRNFYAVLRKCAANGMTVIVITHRMQEVLDFMDYVHIFRQGKAVATQQISQNLLPEQLISAVFSPAPTEECAEVCRNWIKGTQQSKIETAETDLLYCPASEQSVRVFESHCDDTMGLYLSHITAHTGQRLRFSNFSFYAPKGMITGVVGIKNQGIELLEAVLTGQTAIQRGECRFNGELLTQCKNIAYIPSKRLERGLIPEQSIAKNSIIRCRKAVYPYGIFSRKSWNMRIAALKNLLPRDPHEPASVLSGGMMQKLIFNRELTEPFPRLIICAEPYWGLDRNAQELLLQKLNDYAAAGAAVVMLTSDIDTALGACDSIHVLYGGRLTHSARPPYDRQIISAAMMQASTPDSVYA